ncbi:hypothetical protein LCGC14_0960990 [marine sediment metagenome]|uniref:Portal protein n=1 Tax=marine sediment metagenome TaxID=412755 RepID=A0A0F9NEG9_9ZZZZ
MALFDEGIFANHPSYKDLGEAIPVVSSEKHPEVEKSEELLEEYASARLDHANTYFENNQFRNGIQLTDKQQEEYKRRRQSPVPWNILKPTIEQKKALLTANHPSYQVTAVEDSDVNSSFLINDCLGHVWYISEASGEMKAAIDDVCIGGLGYMIAYKNPMADWGKGEVFNENVAYLDVYPDPDSKHRHFKDAAHILIAKRLTEAQLIAYMPNAEPLLIDGMITESLGTRYPDGYTTDIEGSGRYAAQNQQIDVPDTLMGVKYYEVIDRYTKITQPNYRVYDPETNYEKIFNQEQYNQWIAAPAFVLNSTEGDKIITSPQEVAEFVTFLQEMGEVFHFMPDGQIMPGPEHEGAVPGSTHLIEATTMGALVESERIVSLKIDVDRVQRIVSAGGQLLHEEIQEIDEYPIVPFMEGHNRNPYPVATTTLAVPIQTHLNKTKSLLMAYLANATNVKVMIGKGTIDKEELRSELAKAGAAIIEVDFDIGPVPVVLSPVAIPSNAYAEVQDARAEIERLYGIFSFGQGDPGSAPEVYKMGLLLDEHQGRRIGSQLNDFYESLNLLARVTIQLIQNTYTERKTFRLLQPNNKPKDVELNRPVYDEYSRELIGRINDVTMGKYDVQAEAGSTLPSQRWMEREYYRTLYKEGIGDEEMVLRNSDVKDVEEVLARKDKLRQAVQMIEQMGGQIKELEGRNQRLDSEVVHLRQSVEVGKYKGRLKEDELEVHKATQLYTERLNDILKLVKAQA